MKVCDIYNMQDVYECKTEQEARNCLNQIKGKIGRLAPCVQGSVSKRQCISAHNAMIQIRKKNYLNAMCKIYDFLHNDGADKHELSNEEFIVLDILLMVIGE